MAARGYVAPVDVYERAQRGLSATILALVPGLIEAAEAYLDARLGRSWMVTITDEFYAVSGPSLYLRSTPVTSVTAVKYWGGIGTGLTALTVDSDYAVRSLTAGWLELASWPRDGVYVTYVPAATAPPLAREACLRLVLFWLERIRSAVPTGATSFAIPGDFSVTYSNPAQSFGASPDAEELIAAITGNLVFA